MEKTKQTGLHLSEEKLAEKSYAFQMGYDCAINGTSDKNCHFTIFDAPDKTEDWEKGKSVGEFITM